MIVFSDGQPAAYSIMGSVQPDLKRAVKEVTAAGIETIGIGIMSNAVSQYYPRSFVINRVDDLTGTMLKELKRLLVQ